MANADSHSDDDVCPYCGEKLTNEAVCKHWVSSLCDDDGGGDWVTPLYYAWTEHHNESHYNMIGCFDEYFEVLCGLCNRVVKAGPNEAKRIRSEAKRLPPAERAILAKAVQLVGRLGTSEDYETSQDLLRGEGFDSQLKTFFTKLFRQARGKRMATNWLIDSGRPGAWLEWTGTHYWAEDAAKCIHDIIGGCEIATRRIQRLIRRPKSS